MGLSKQQICFTFFWLILLNWVAYFLTKIVLKNEQKARRILDQEWVIIGKEKSNINLIENMGLTTHYRKKQRETSLVNEKVILKDSHFRSLNKAIPSNLLMDIFPFLLLSLNRGRWDGIVLVNF
jgi:hypothetical protein